MANVRVELSGRIPSRAELMARREPGAGVNSNSNNTTAYGDRSVLRDNDPAYRDDQAANDADDATGDIPPTLPPQAGRWHEYREGGRVYYYRDGPAEVRRVYRRVHHYYRRFGGFPFW